MKHYEFQAQQWAEEASFLLAAGDSYTSAEIVNEGRKALQQKYPEIVIEQLENPAHKISDVIEHASMFGLMGEKRLVVYISDQIPTEKDKDALLTFAESFPEGNVLMLRYPAIRPSKWLKSIQEKCTYVNCSTSDWKWADAKAYVQSGANERGIKINSEAVSMMIDRLGVDMGVLENALTLMELSEESQVLWDGDRVERFFFGQAQSSVFDLAEAIANHDLNKSLSLMDWFLRRGTQIAELMGGLRFQFRRLLMYKTHEESLNRNAMMKQLGIRSSFLFKKLEQQASKFSLARLKKIYLELYNLDYESKMSHNREKDLLEMFILKLIFGA